jgi:hypothetical protein
LYSCQLNIGASSFIYLWFSVSIHQWNIFLRFKYCNRKQSAISINEFLQKKIFHGYRIVRDLRALCLYLGCIWAPTLALSATILGAVKPQTHYIDISFERWPSDCQHRRNFSNYFNYLQASYWNTSRPSWLFLSVLGD